MGKGRIKRILRLCHFELFDKGEGRHKRIQAVSPLFFQKRRRETQKEFRRLVLGEFFLAKGEENEKMNSTSFQGIENPKTLECFWHKEEEKVQRDSRLVKDCIGLIERLIENAKQSLAFIDSSCLAKGTIQKSYNF